MKQGMKKFLGWIIIIVSAAGFAYSYLKLENLILAFIFVFALIIGVTLKNSTTRNGFYESAPGFKKIADTNGITFEQLANDFMKVETPLGKPRIGQASINVKESLVYGPTELDEYLYVYYMNGQCCISGTGMENIKNAKNKNPFKAIKTAYTFADKFKVEALYKTVRHYFETGKVEWQEV